jgi:protein deglycase
MTKILMPLADGFEDIEAFVVIDVLRRAGLDVTTVGLTGKNVESAQKMRVMADTSFHDIDPKTFDVIVLPGGNPGYKNLMRSQAINLAVHDFAKQGKIIAAICGAPLLLAKAGLLEGKRATIHPGWEKELDMPRSDRVVVDGNFITSQGPGTTFEFAFAIVSKLLGKPHADDLKKRMLVQ